MIKGNIGYNRSYNPHMQFADIVLWIILALSIVAAITMVTNLWVMVPYVPTSYRVVKRMIDLAECTGNETVYDLGCGDGRILISANKRYPGILAIGYELSMGVWMLAKLKVLWSRKKIPIYMKNYLGADVSDADIIFLYLFPEVMSKLRKKFDAELRPGTTVISHGFPFADKEPVHVERVELPSWHMMKPPKQKGPRVFVYKW